MNERIPARARAIRVLVALVVAGGFAFVAAFDPARGAPFPRLDCAFHAASGLPCLFCGATRACHAALNGDIPQAMALNSVALPVIFIVGFLAALLLAEALTGRTLLPWRPVLAGLKRGAPIAGVLAVLWWIPHVVFAVRSGNPALVDLHKPAAAWVKSWIAPRASE